MAEEKISSIVQAKLMPGETVIGQTKTMVSDLIATDKRILRFSSNDFDSIDNTEVTGIRYGTFKGKKMSSRIIVTFLCLVLVGMAIGIWGIHFDTSVRNNISLSNTILLSIGIGVFVLLMLTAIYTFDYGFYQIEGPKIDKKTEKYWKVMRPMFGAKKIDAFFQTVSKQTNKEINKKKR